MSRSERSLSAIAVQFTHELSLDAIPADVVNLARLHIADAIGVGLAAASVSTHRRLLAGLLEQQPVGGQSTVLGFRQASTAPVAAMLNGTSMHSLEYDDTHMASIVHGSAVIVPAALAAAEAQGLSLDDLVVLVVAGWEVLVRLGQASPGGFQQRGFQVTSVGGVLVAALLGAVARGMSLSESVAAMGIAGSQAGGIFEFLSNGSNVKALHPGWAAHAGLWAVDLARFGMTGPATVLEGRFGLFNTYAADSLAGQRMSEELQSLGSEWRLRDAAFKLYPCCHYIHPYLECAQSIRAELGEKAAQGTVLCRVAPGAAPVICDPWEGKQQPSSANEAKYSLPYCVARVLQGKPIDLASMTTEPIDAEAVALAHRIQWEPRPDSPFPQRFDADLSVHLPDGQRIHRFVSQVNGSAQRPASSAMIQAKFLSNSDQLLGDAASRRVWESLMADNALISVQQLLRDVRA